MIEIKYYCDKCHQEITDDRRYRVIFEIKRNDDYATVKHEFCKSCFDNFIRDNFDELNWEHRNYNELFIG